MTSPELVEVELSDEELRHVRPPEPGESWAPVDLRAVLTGDDPEPGPSMLQRSDGTGLIYAGKAHAIIGETETAKTFVALHACRQELEAGRSVVFVDYEDTARTIARRLLALGAEEHAILERFRYVAPEEALDERAWRSFAAALEGGPSLVVVDGVTEALGRQGLNLNDNHDVQRFYDLLPRRVAQTGAAVVLLDHVVKDREARGRYALGGQHKLAGIDGAAYVLEAVMPFGRGSEGVIRLTVSKDRPGFVRGLPDRGRSEIRISANDDGTDVSISVDPSPTDDDGSLRPTTLMRKVSRLLEDTPEGLSQRKVRELVQGRKDYVVRALEALVEEGYVVREEGSRNALLHRSVRPFREGLTDE